MNEQRETEAKSMNIIAAYTKLPGTVDSHESVENVASDPVRVETINASGAWPETNIKGDQIVIYDLIEYDEQERVEYLPDGFVEVDPGVWVQAFTQEIHVDLVPRVETFAVAVDPKLQSVDELRAEPAPVLPGRGDDDGGGEVTEFLGESQG